MTLGTSAAALVTMATGQPMPVEIADAIDRIETMSVRIQRDEALVLAWARRTCEAATDG